MHTYKHVGLACHVAFYQRHMVLVIDQRAVADRDELTEGGRQRGRDHPLDQLVVLAAIGNELGDRNHLQAVPLAIRLEVSDPGHAAVVVHDLADHPRRDEPREPRQVDSSLGLTHPLEHAAQARLERENVTGLYQVARRRAGIDRHLDRARPIVGGDTGGHALARFDRNGEGGFEG
jgi:hypothetical protein